MGKYYKVSLEQVTKEQGYIKENDRLIKTDFSYCLLRTKKQNNPGYKSVQNIIVEKISRFKAREVKTGIIFPIVYFELSNEYYNQKKHFSISCIGHLHTFIIGKKDDLNMLREVTYQEIKTYDEQHTDPKTFKEELLSILATGKTYMDERLIEEKIESQRNREQLIQLKQKNQQSTKEESAMIKKLKRKFKEGRKAI